MADNQEFIPPTDGTVVEDVQFIPPTDGTIVEEAIDSEDVKKKGTTFVLRSRGFPV